MPAPAWLAAIGKVLPSIIGAGGAIGAGALQQRHARQMQDRQNQENRYMSELAYQRDIEMWNRQNQYNDPSSQMQRLKDAGLNPNLVYGTGAVGNQSGAPPSYNPPHIEYKTTWDVPGILAQYNNLKLQSAQVAQVQAMTRNIEERTETEGLTQVLKNIQGRVSSATEAEQILAPTLRNWLTRSQDQLTGSKQDAAATIAGRLRTEMESGKWQADITRSKADASYAQTRAALASDLRSYGLRETDHIALRWLGMALSKSGIDFFKQLGMRNPKLK